MDDSSIAHWHPAAAYLYVLHLDGPALAWEYLRRHPDYRRDWRRCGHRPHAARQAAQRWGLRLLEDPALDVRDAQPLWLASPQSAQLHPDADPPPEAVLFRLWRLPGEKRLIHDGARLMLRVRCPRGCLRLVIAPGLADGMACVLAQRVGVPPPACVLLPLFDQGHSVPAGRAAPMTVVRPRPMLSALQELHTLQALDAILAGASLREVACGLFGVSAVARDWHADGALRARVRRLVRRGNALMRGGYRRLAQLERPAQGRSSPPAQRP